MISLELDAATRPIVTVQSHADTNGAAWVHLRSALSRGIINGGKTQFEVRAEVFLSELSNVRGIRQSHQETFEFGPALTLQLERLKADRIGREAVANRAELFEPDYLGRLAEELTSAGFTRTLMPFQLKNLAILSNLPHGADFSVPGAGKTTVALANFALQRLRNRATQIMVVAPIAAFEAWKVDSEACLSSPPSIEVHNPRQESISSGTQLLLSNYNRVAADYERVQSYISRSTTQLVLDEAHRVKRGADGVHGRAVIDLAHAAARRDVLTGTPAPQSAYDLVALMRFLYPGQDRAILPSRAFDPSLGRDPDVVAETSRSIRRFFVRTPKSELGLRRPIWDVVQQEMGPLQSQIYDALVGRYRGQFQLTTTSRRDFDRLGRISMYLIEAASNPALLVAGSDEVDEPEYRHPPLELRGDLALSELLQSYGNFERPWKYDYILQEVTAAHAAGHKVLIWSTFIRNIMGLKRLLSAYQPAVLHGGIPLEDAAGPDATITREGEIERFRNDSSCAVMIANPAAAGEGLSLHHWCHHAIYLDRTFNAGQFLQSQDRIHRLGLSPETDTRFTLLISRDSVDETIDGRLREKVRVLGTLMDDPGLVNVALPEADEVNPPAISEMNDASAVLNHIERRG